MATVMTSMPPPPLPSTFRNSTTSIAGTALSNSTANNPISYSDSPLTQLPNVDFNFEDLRRRMAEFTVRFDAFIEKGRKRVLEERNEFRGRLGEINEDQKSTGTQIITLQTSLSQHNQIQAREQQEKTEMHSQITSLESHQSNQLATRDRLRSSMTQTQRQIDNKLQAQREYSRKIDSQSRLNGPELMFWETFLGCRIEGAGEEDVVRVVFVFPPGKSKPNLENTSDSKSLILHNQSEREAVFELKIPDSGSGGYEIIHSKPKLDSVKTALVLNKLNETREIGTLLKGMRELFGEMMR